MTQYINKKGYTDVRSYQVLEIDEKNGVATVIEVEKKPTKLEYEVGGFAAHFSNLEEAFANAPITIMEGAKPFQLRLRNDGYWYRGCHKGYTLDKRVVDAERMKSNDKYEVVVDDLSVHFFEKTKTGKLKTVWTKFGKMEDECKYFYDYNF